MIEVPSMLWQLDGLAAVADFASVGTNDLLQFFTATDRGNMLVAHRFDALSRPFLRALKAIAATLGPRMPVTVCGELAGNPLAAMTLIGLGFRSLSMSPAAIGPVKAMILALDAGKATATLEQLIAGDEGEPSLRQALARFADAQDLPH
jgi:phosphotransferase system enzyme I (PtsP)